MELEIWKDIKGFETQYQISSFGNIRSLDRYDNCNRFRNGRLLIKSKEKDGYEYITLWKNSKSKSYFIHRLVAYAFLNLPLDNNFVVNHIDGNKQNNHYKNLEWLSVRDNVIHALKNNLRKSGENHPWAKLTNDQVLEIPKLLELGYTQKKISKIYNVSYSCIKNICQKRKWKYLSDNVKD